MQDYLDHLMQQLKEQYDLLKEYGAIIYTATSPREQANAEREQASVRTNIQKIEQEINTARESIAKANTTSYTPPPANNQTVTPTPIYQPSATGNVSSAKALRVFISYSPDDAAAVVEKLYEPLQNETEFTTWFDEDDLIPGQNWDLEKEKALRTSAKVVICFSSRTANKAGYLQREINRAIDAAKEKPPEAVFVIPVKLDPCELPSGLAKYTAVDLSNQERGYRQLLRALRL